MLMQPVYRLGLLVRRALRWISPAAVLVADDDEAVRTLCAKVLMRAGYVVETVSDGREALARIRKYSYSSILLDLGMPYLHGATLLSLLEREQPEVLERLIVITGASDAVLAGVAERVGAVLRKPMKVDEIVAAVRERCGDPPLFSNDQTARIS